MFSWTLNLLNVLNFLNINFTVFFLKINIERNARCGKCNTKQRIDYMRLTCYIVIDVVVQGDRQIETGAQ